MSGSFLMPFNLPCITITANLHLSSSISRPAPPLDTPLPPTIKISCVHLRCCAPSVQPAPPVCSLVGGFTSGKASSLGCRLQPLLFNGTSKHFDEWRWGKAARREAEPVAMLMTHRARSVLWRRELLWISGYCPIAWQMRDEEGWLQNLHLYHWFVAYFLFHTLYY